MRASASVAAPFLRAACEQQQPNMHAFAMCVARRVLRGRAETFFGDARSRSQRPSSREDPRSLEPSPERSEPASPSLRCPEVNKLFQVLSAKQHAGCLTFTLRASGSGAFPRNPVKFKIVRSTRHSLQGLAHSCLHQMAHPDLVLTEPRCGHKAGGLAGLACSQVHVVLVKQSHKKVPWCSLEELTQGSARCVGEAGALLPRCGEPGSSEPVLRISTF